MREILRAALVIARRDYIASVWSRTFLLFLIGPLLPIVAGIFFGAMGSDTNRKAGPPLIAVIAAPADRAALTEARARLASRIGSELPDLRFSAPAGDPVRQAAALLADETHGVAAVVQGGLDAPTLVGPQDAIAEQKGTLALIWDEARAARSFAANGTPRPLPIMIAAHAIERPAGNDAAARQLTARMGQLVLMMLTMILAGMLLSNLIEEKSNKVIEVLAAAVPVDAIFLGKLIAMLGMSLTGITVWATSAVVVVTTLFPAAGAAMPPPAVGWPLFIALGIVYFVACYLLLGALFLGIGAQASSVREVQTLSMPVTMAQLGVVALASTVVATPESGLAYGAMLFPWSSPFAMLARAAQSPMLWPHLLAILWQAGWITLIIRLASRRFRRHVLKSGGPKAKRGFFGLWRRGMKPSG